MPISHARRLWLMQTRYAFPCLAANAREIAEKVERRTAGGMEGGTSDREKGPFNCKQGTGHSRMLEGNTDNITDSKALGLAATKSASILSSRCSKYMSTFTICILRNNHEVKATAHQTPLICTAAALPPGKVPVDFAAVALDDSAIALTAIIAGAAAERQSSHLKMI